MGTGVMIGAGIFALTGQIVQLAGPMFPLAVLVGAIITGFSAYSTSGCQTLGRLKVGLR
jgi:amino acid transporter